MNNLFIAAETVLLAFQNYILMLGTSAFIPALLVPAMGGSDVSFYTISFSIYILSCNVFEVLCSVL